MAEVAPGPRATTSVIFEDIDGRTPQPIACAASVFVTDSFLRHLKTHPLPWIGPELVRRVIRDEPGILPAEAIREANSSEGLNLVVWIPGISRVCSPEDLGLVGLEIMRCFEHLHFGYRLKEFIDQPVGLRPILMTMNTGVLFWQALEGRYVDGRSLPVEGLTRSPFVIGITRELALRDLGNWISSVFLYSPPRIYFRPSEQRLLLAALRGLTDEELAAELCISLSAVKKTWRSVYDRAAEALPLELPTSPTEDIEAKRGKEKKQHLLAYLRGHMEELRPVLSPRGRT